MTLRPRNWLPFGAFETDALTAALAEAVSQWSERCFGPRRVTLAQARPRVASALAAKASWQSLGGIVFFGWSDEVAIDLAKLALDIAKQQKVVTATDRTLLVHLGAKIARSLSMDLQQCLSLPEPDPAPGYGVDDPFAGEGALEIRLRRADDGHLMSLAVNLAELVPFRKSRIGTTCLPADEIGDIANALDRVPIGFRALLGTARLSAADLQGLAPGDVLILDKSVDDDLALVLDHSEIMFCRAKLVSEDGQMRLNVANQWSNRSGVQR